MCSYGQLIYRLARSAKDDYLGVGSGMNYATKTEIDGLRLTKNTI